MAAIGVVVTGMAAIGMAAIGMAAIGVVAIGMVVTGTAAIGVITSSSSATSGFPTGGAGVGAIRTDTTVTVTPTITMAPAMAMTATEMMVTDMITVGTAIAADPGSLNCSGDSVALAIIVALSTGFWGPRRDERFEITNASMEMLADR